MNALGLLTATFHDNHLFGPETMDYLSAVASDGKQVIRLAAGMTALARLLIGMRAEQTGVPPEQTLKELGGPGSPNPRTNGATVTVAGVSSANRV